MDAFEQSQPGQYDLILMDAHIAKPVQISNLKATIQKVLDSRLEQTKEAENV